MAGPSITFDVTGVPDDDLNFYAGPDPVRGTYSAKVADVSLGKSKGDKDMLTIRYEITEGQYKGWAGWDRITLEPSTAFKLKQFITATGVKAKGTIDQLIKLSTGKQVGILITIGSWEGEPRPEIKRSFPKSALGPATSTDEDDARTDSEADDAEPEEDVDDENEGDGELYTEEELKALTKAQLYEVAVTDLGLEGFTTKSPATKLIAAILLAQEAADDDEEPDDEETEEEEGDEEDAFDREARKAELEGSTRLQLKQLLKAAESEFVVKKSTTDEAILEAVLDAEEAAAESDEEDDSEPPF